MHLYAAKYVCTMYPFHVTAEFPCESEENQKDPLVSIYRMSNTKIATLLTLTLPMLINIEYCAKI